MKEIVERIYDRKLISDLRFIEDGNGVKVWCKRSKYKIMLPTEINEIKINNRPTVIIPMSPDGALFDNFKIMFPNGNVENKNSFLVYKIIN